MTLIRGNTELPAVREDVDFVTTDGLRLVGELAMPVGRPPVATLVTLHPLTTHGGFMDSHIFRKAALRLPELADVAVLRFNLRGATSPRGTSEGGFGDGVGEEHDVEAAMHFVEQRGLPNVWLVGWSFGTELVLKYGRRYSIEGAILLSPPLHRATDAEVAAWHGAGIPVTALVPEFDDFLKPAEAAERFAAVPELDLVAVEGGKHLWVGEAQTARVLNEIVSRVNPAKAPLPTSLP